MHEKSLEEEKTSSLRWHLQNGRGRKNSLIDKARSRGGPNVSRRVVDCVTKEENEKLEVRLERQRKTYWPTGGMPEMREAL